MQRPGEEEEDLGWWMMMELECQDVMHQYWLSLKNESSCSMGWGEHILSECKGPVQRGGINLHVVTHSPLEMSVLQCDQLFPLMHKQK